MNRAALLGAIVLGAMLLLAATAGGGTTVTKPTKILGLSHTHPANSDTSWVCGKIKKTTVGKTRVTVHGPGATVPDEDYDIIIKGKGTKLVSFEIAAPGRYVFRAKTGKRFLTSKGYTVPRPPKPAQGTFACPQG